MELTYERTRWFVLLLGSAVVVTTQPPFASQTAPKLKILASTSDLAAVAAEDTGTPIEVEYLARETQREIVNMRSSERGDKGADNYFHLFDHDLALLAKALGSRTEDRLRMGFDYHFLLLMLDNSLKVKAMALTCSEKHIRQELRTLCRQVIDIREKEAQILKRWLTSWYYAGAPSENATPVPLRLVSADGSQFEITFLSLMVQQDEEELRTAKACIAKHRHRDLGSFCEMLERARTVEMQLMRSQLCLWHSHCRSSDKRDG